MIKPTLTERIRAWWGKQLVRVLVAWRTWQNVRARRNHKCLWRCYRDGGGGAYVTPKPMTEDYAVAWVARVLNAEVFYVDFEHRFIFYRTKGNQ